MRTGTPSKTALAVALARALATFDAPPSPDPVAGQLLPRRLRGLLRLVTPAMRGVPSLVRGVRIASGGFVDHLALRTAAIDEVLERAIGDGVRQVVIVGAGLDGRAYRLDSLRQTTVWEIDHPSTQRFKRSRVRELLPFAAEVRFVSVDFERDSIGAGLEAADHDATRPTVWIWEGVVMYLTPDATRGTLAALRERSAEGSILALTYLRGDDPTLGSPLAQPALSALRALGEPFDGLMTTSECHAAVTTQGWRVLTDESPSDWRERFGYGRAATWMRAERLLVATCAP